MQLASPSTPDPATRDVAAAIRDAQRVIGQGPAITLILPDGRQEQGMASLAQWAAKGAHLIEADLLLQPGDQLALDAPLSWSGAAVCLAAWWAGVSITLVTDDDRLTSNAEVTVVHEDRWAITGHSGDVLVLGDAYDGSPHGDVDAEPWARAVQAFPDQPPIPHAGADAMALTCAGRSWTQAELLAEARDMATGTIGVDAGAVAPWRGLIAAAARPLISGRPTVIVRGVGHDAAAGDRVAQWL